MNRCLNQRALLDVATGEGTAAQRSHLRECADCVERCDALRDDLEAIDGVITRTRPASSAAPRPVAVLVHWAPAAAAVVSLLAVQLTVSRLLTPAPVQVAARPGAMAAFAADVSAALFAAGETTEVTQVAAAAPYLQAALESGLPCTQERFLIGQCNDAVATDFYTD